MFQKLDQNSRLFKVTRSEAGAAFFQRGAMQAVVREREDGLVPVIYEHALHQITKEKITPEAAARLIVAVFQRQSLCRVGDFGPG